MLIVNADDLGRQQTATDAALACYAKKRITSASAMVFMRDSERAAELALSSEIDVGLHINLSEAFSGRSVPTRLQEHHGQITRFLGISKYALLVYHPWLAEKFRYVFEMQHAEFVRLYGRAPSHFDGHQHMHLATNMLVNRILPEGTKVRRSFSFEAGEKSPVNRWYRGLVDRRLKRRHRLTDYFFSLAHQLPPERFDRVIRLAQGATVELMTHPQNPREFDFLMSERFGAVTSQVRLASHDAL